MAFLKVVSLEEAISIINSFRLEIGFEEVTLDKALGRIVAEDIYSPLDIPPFDRSTVDGYAVRAEDTFMASEANPVELKVIGEVHAGEQPSVKLSKGEAVYITTGSMMPENANAVIPFEDVEREGDIIRIYKPAYPGLGVMKKGTDIKKGQLLIRRGTKLTFKETALLSAAGFLKVKVFKRPRVAVISTGNEIVLPGEELRPGQIYDINGRAIVDAVNELGGEGIFVGIARDDRESLKKLILQALEVGDVIVISGGASGGIKDLTASVIEELGEVKVHGIAIQPGKPTIIGVINGKPVFGLPGYPTSCLTNFTLLVAPLLLRVLGREGKIKKVKAKMKHKVFSVKGRRRFLPVKLEEDVAVPILKGSGAVTSFVEADGFVEIPENVESLDEGEEVTVTLFSF